MKRILATATTLVTTCLLATACASGPPARSVPIEKKMAGRGYTVGAPVKRLKDYRINGWNAVDRYHIIIHLDVRDDYLVTVRSPCDGFRYAEVVRFSTTVGDLTDKDKLIVRGAGGIVEQCFIQSIRVLHRTRQPGGRH